jgi:hypothetical protein
MTRSATGHAVKADSWHMVALVSEIVAQPSHNRAIGLPAWRCCVCRTPQVLAVTPAKQQQRVAAMCGSGVASLTGVVGGSTRSAGSSGSATCCPVLSQANGVSSGPRGLLRFVLPLGGSRRSCHTMQALGFYQQATVQ